MANEIEKYNLLALSDIQKINGFTDSDIEKLNGFEYTGATLMKGIFGFGYDGTNVTAVTNLVTNAGIIGSDVSGVGQTRYQLAAAEYGTGTAIFGFGRGWGKMGMTNLVNTSGVVASDVSAVGTARSELAACTF